MNLGLYLNTLGKYTDNVHVGKIRPIILNQRGKREVREHTQQQFLVYSGGQLHKSESVISLVWVSKKNKNIK